MIAYFVCSERSIQRQVYAHPPLWTNGPAYLFGFSEKVMSLYCFSSISPLLGRSSWPKNSFFRSLRWPPEFYYGSKSDPRLKVRGRGAAVLGRKGYRRGAFGRRSILTLQIITFSNPSILLSIWFGIVELANLDPQSVRWPKARPYLDHGFLELNNKTVERAVRPFTLEGKKYRFTKLEAGANPEPSPIHWLRPANSAALILKSWLLERIKELLPWEYQALIDGPKAEVETKNGNLLTTALMLTTLVTGLWNNHLRQFLYCIAMGET